MGDLYRTNEPVLGGGVVNNRIACFLTCGYTEAGKTTGLISRWTAAGRYALRKNGFMVSLFY